jgi:hypothetical protein
MTEESTWPGLVERSRRFVDAANRRDVEALMSEFVYVDGPEPASGRGHAAMWSTWSSMLSAWRDHRAAGEEYRELADGGVLTLTTFSGRGRAGGIELPKALARGASVMSGHDGLVTKIVLYMNRDRALADLGLEE